MAILVAHDGDPGRPGNRWVRDSFGGLLTQLLSEPGAQAMGSWPENTNPALAFGALIKPA